MNDSDIIEVKSLSETDLTMFKAVVRKQELIALLSMLLPFLAMDATKVHDEIQNRCNQLRESIHYLDDKIKKLDKEIQNGI